MRASSLLNEQVFALKALTNLLKNAYQGLDVEWDMEEVFHGGESSGVGPIASSGDGSGDEDAEQTGAAGSTATADGAAAHTPPPPAPTAAGGATPAVVAAATTTPRPGGAADDDDGYEIDRDRGNRVDARPPVGGDGGGSSSAGHGPKMSLRKALATYLLPVVAVWFGGSFLEWIL